MYIEVFLALTLSFFAWLALFFYVNYSVGSYIYRFFFSIITFKFVFYSLFLLLTDFISGNNSNIYYLNLDRDTLALGYVIDHVSWFVYFLVLFFLANQTAPEPDDDFKVV